jgi:lactoylglutathione lyase
MAARIQGLRTTIYKVTDIAEAKVWYTNMFGVKPYFDESFYVGFNIEGYELGLQPDEVRGEKGDNVVAYWGVDDVSASYKRFTESGALGYEAPQEVGGDIIVAVVKDPWGNAIGLIHNPHFKLP